MMEADISVPSRPAASNAECDQLIVDLYYYRAALKQAGGTELAIYLIEMAIAELTLQSGVHGSS